MMGYAIPQTGCNHSKSLQLVWHTSNSLYIQKHCNRYGIPIQIRKTLLLLIKSNFYGISLQSNLSYIQPGK